MTKQEFEDLNDLERLTERGMWWVRLDRVLEIIDAIRTRTLKEAEEVAINTGTPFSKDTVAIVQAIRKI